jgi:C4-dicarboxylate-specific signal transduction histidine kinase
LDDQSATASAAADHPANPVAAAPPLAEQLLGIARISDLEEMASGIAHELNQPLGAIVTFAQAGERMLQRPDAPLASVREVLQLISKEALAAGAGIRGMRQLFARGTMSKVRCSMTETLEELTPLLTALARQYRHEAGGPVRLDSSWTCSPSCPR